MRLALATDPSAIKAAAAATSVVSGTGAALTADWSVALFGVPLAVVLAAFAGAVIALSFVAPMTWGRVASSVAGGTVAGSYVQPLAAHYLQVPPGGSLGVAFVVGLAGMATIPLVIAWVPELLRAFSDRIRGGGGGR